MRILLVEDDELLGDGVKTGLKQAGYTVDWLADGESADHALKSEHFDLIVLDLALPGKSGLDILQRMRADNDLTPVLILTAKDTVEDRVKGLDCGADDYLVKPFDLSELTARVLALLRRSSGRAENILTYRNLELNTSSHSVKLGEELINLPRREFALLHKLLEHVGQVLSREQLTQSIYGWEEDLDSNALEVHIHNLRKKLDADFIRTIRGVGYMIEKDKQ